MSKSAEAFSINNHFDGKDPVVQKIYERILTVCKAMGPVGVEPKKTSIHLVRSTAFAGIATRSTYLILTIKSDRQMKSRRIHKSQHTSANRFHHETKIEKPADVDAELIGWLKSAYALSA
jgi:hypothetical protein